MSGKYRAFCKWISSCDIEAKENQKRASLFMVVRFHYVRNAVYVTFFDSIISDYVLLLDCFKSGLPLLSQVKRQILLCINMRQQRFKSNWGNVCRTRNFVVDFFPDVRFRLVRAFNETLMYWLNTKRTSV